MAVCLYIYITLHKIVHPTGVRDEHQRLETTEIISNECSFINFICWTSNMAKQEKVPSPKPEDLSLGLTHMGERERENASSSDLHIGTYTN